MAGILDKIRGKKKDNKVIDGVVKDIPKKTVKKEEKKEVKKTTPKKAEKKEEKKEEIKKEAEKKTSVSKKPLSHSRAHSVLIKTHVTEKATSEEIFGKYTFVVNRESSKVEIKNAVKDVYGVLPVKVRVIHMDGKKTSTGRIRGKRKDWKKAIITLPKGKTIDVHSGV